MSPSQSNSNSTTTSSFTFSTFSTSHSSSTINGQTTSRSETTSSGPSGTRVHRTSQDPGQEKREEWYETDHAGRRIEGNDARRIKDVTDEEQEQEKRDGEYEERMEEEYAKREGGA